MGDLYFKALESGLITVTGVGTQQALGLNPWVLEEPIDVIAASLHIFCAAQSQNDGEAWMEACVSHGSHVIQQGAMIFGWACEVWNTTPAFGNIVPLNINMVFPQDYRPHYAEGETLVLNAVYEGKTVGDSKWYIDAIVAYRPTRRVRR